MNLKTLVCSKPKGRKQASRELIDYESGMAKTAGSYLHQPLEDRDPEIICATLHEGPQLLVVSDKHQLLCSMHYGNECPRLCHL